MPPDLGVHHAREPLPLPATTDGMASLARALNLPEEADALAALAAIDAHEFGGGRPWPCRHFWRSLLCRQMGEGTAVLMRDTDGHAAEEEVEQEEEEEDEGEGEEDGGEMSTTYYAPIIDWVMYQLRAASVILKVRACARAPSTT